MLDPLVCCPACAGDLAESGDSLRCANCEETYVVRNAIPRFVPAANYAGNFGFQWNTHARTQIDRFNGTTISRDRFFLATQWPENLAGESILEAGCGAGRFTDVIARTGAHVVSFDLSTAVDAARTNTEGARNVTFLQADIFRPPLRAGSFDRIFCFGVIQHTPDPKRAFMSLTRLLKPDGEIAIDVYDLERHRFPHPKYWIRPITKRLPAPLLHSLLMKSAPVLFPLKRALKRAGPVGRAASKLIPMYDYSGKLPLNEQQLREWAVLDTLDGLAPRYEYPQTEESIAAWFREAGLVSDFIGPGPNGIVARGRMSARAACAS